MMVTTEQINIFILGMLTALIISIFYNIIIGVIHGATRRISDKEKNILIDRLQSQGYSVYQLITDSGGRLTPAQTKDAMLLKSCGCLVFDDSRRELVGRLLRPRLTSNEKAEERRSQFKLVVSNDRIK